LLTVLRPALRAMVLLGFLCAKPSAQTSYSEYEVKAAMLYNLAKFVKWPAHQATRGSGAIAVGVFGSDPFGPLLEQMLRDRTVHGKPILLRRSDSLAELEECQILFIGRAERRQIPMVLRQVRPFSVLTVGETEGFARFGGMVAFKVEDNRLRLQVNLVAAERAGIKISSKLLKLATVVRSGA
jgi:YfiR/HmsC-like